MGTFTTLNPIIRRDREVRKKLLEIRLDLGIALDDVYAATGIQVVRIETGRVEPKMQTLVRILKMYDYTIAEFFYELEEEVPPTYLGDVPSRHLFTAGKKCLRYTRCSL